MKPKFALLGLILTPVWAQSPLSLRDAVRTALANNKSLVASAAGVKAAESRIAQAQSGRLPKVNFSESFTRSDNPVYVFGTLLTQQRFGPENFAIGALNRPDAINNFQSMFTVEQPIFDAGQTRHAVRSAELMHNLSGEARRAAELDVIAGVIRAYYGAVLSAESLKAAREATRSVEADLRRAQSVRDAGMSTDVDVLSIRVHLAGVTEQQIRRSADLDVARAALNDALGLPLDTSHTLATELKPLVLPDLDLPDYERKAVNNRPETRESRLAASLARVQADSARSALLPQVGVRAAWEADRRRFWNGTGTNWLAAVSLKWNLFNGFADQARIREAGHNLRRADADQERAGSGARLQVRRAWADLRAAQQRIEVARAAMAEAQESLRITQNRYEAGMSNVTDLLRTETALLDSRTRYLAAVHDQRIAATMLEYSAGTLNPDSEVMN
ncbi:MAG TPA: TolC family protein [Bryobacteraceae bacterium]|nr:TolC family protein [Bryobacteraceae bacterium]